MNIQTFAERFCAAPLPETVCADPCATVKDYPKRAGTNLMTVTEAKAVLGHVLSQDIKIDFEDWAGEKGFCLDQIFLSTDGVPANPYESGDTHLAYEIWCASRGITPE